METTFLGGVMKIKLAVFVLPVGGSSALFVLNKHTGLIKHQPEIQAKSLLNLLY